MFVFYTVARNKTTTLSSTLEGHISSNAVDGNTDCDEENSTAASRNTFKPHLLIQLDGTYTIERIVIHAKLLELSRFQLKCHSHFRRIINFPIWYYTLVLKSTKIISSMFFKFLLQNTI